MVTRLESPAGGSVEGEYVSTRVDSRVIWIDGKLVPYADATIHVLSHTLHYGTGAFEGMRAYQLADKRTAIFRAREHFQRFIDSVRVFGGTVSHGVDALTQASAEVIRANGFRECYIRPLAFIGDDFRGLKLPPTVELRTAIATWDWGKYLGAEGQQKGIRVRVSSLRRPDVSSAMSMAKITGAYVTSVLARREATLAGVDEALLLDPEGFVAEGSGENLFVVKDGRLSTPPTGFILPGITRDCTIHLARDRGIEVTERRITRNEVYVADEVFFTGTAAEVTPIREVDGLAVGRGCPGPVTARLLEAFFQCVQGKDPGHTDWLTPI